MTNRRRRCARVAVGTADRDRKPRRLVRLIDGRQILKFLVVQPKQECRDDPIRMAVRPNAQQPTL